MTIKEVVTRAVGLPNKELCSVLIERFGVKQTVKWDSVTSSCRAANFVWRGSPAAELKVTMQILY
jgi:hypothetical protein